MSFLLTPEEFVRARAAVREGTVTSELYRWLVRFVRVVQVTRSLAPPPVPSRRWGDPDAIAETVQAWLDDSLLRGGLIAAFDRASSPAMFARYLETSLQRWLIDRNRGGSRRRLLDRAIQILSEHTDLFAACDAGGTRLWTSRGATVTAADERDERDLNSLVWGLGEFTILRYRGSERSDPVLSTEDLTEFLVRLVGELNGGLSDAVLERILHARFTHAFEVTEVGLDAALQVAAPDETEQHEIINDLVRVALRRLTRRQAEVILLRPPATLEEVAAALGISRGTADNEARRGVATIAEVCANGDECRAVLERLRAVASLEVDDV